MEPFHRTSDDEEPTRSLGRRALRNLGLLVAATVLVVVGGLLAGYLFAKGSPERAASTVVSQFVVREDSIGDEVPRADEPAPTSGRWTEGQARCGLVREPVPVADQLATLATGAVIVQYRPTTEPAAPLLTELARRRDVLVAPNPDLSDPVVATAWTQRMVLPDATPELLFAFVTAHRGFGPEAVERCPVAEGP